MLLEITSENIAIMEKAELSFGPGFTAITGETGAGKSLLVGAISLCLGERADSDMVRTGAAKAFVQAVFQPSKETLAILDELGFASEDGLLYLQREIASEGKSACRINGKLAPLSSLKRIGDTLADLHGQHEHQSLLNPTNHIKMLDEWMGETAAAPRERVAKAFAAATELRAKRKELEHGEREREQRVDLLSFQVQEITEANVAVGEIHALELELQRLKNAESIVTALAGAAITAYEGEVSARDLISQTMKQADAACALDPQLSHLLEPLRSAQLSLETAVDALKAAKEAIEFNPAKIEEIAERLDMYARLRRKYGETEEEILEFLNKASETLSLSRNAQENLEAIEKTLALAERELLDSCVELTELRLEKSHEFADAVAKELTDLAIPNAEFSIHHEGKPPEADGADNMQFMFSANIGESQKPLAKIASGGEMSRVMLAIKTVLAGRGGVPTMIFDEIDSGLSGQAAAVVAKKLEKLSSNYQIIAITHLPQIASRASSQISIEKREEEGRIRTKVRRLDADERIPAIARMLAGETVGDAAIENARQLLGNVR